MNIEEADDNDWVTHVTQTFSFILPFEAELTLDEALALNEPEEPDALAPFTVKNKKRQRLIVVRSWLLCRVDAPLITDVVN